MIFDARRVMHHYHYDSHRKYPRPVLKNTRDAQHHEPAGGVVTLMTAFAACRTETVAAGAHLMGWMMSLAAKTYRTGVRGTMKADFEICETAAHHARIQMVYQLESMPSLRIETTENGE